MLVKVNGTVSSVWADSFKGRDGEDVEYYRALVTCPGEKPMQLGVRRDKFEELVKHIGKTGVLLLELDAQPGQRARIYFDGIA